jgi:hypothetical protein
MATLLSRSISNRLFLTKQNFEVDQKTTAHLSQPLADVDALDVRGGVLEGVEVWRIRRLSGKQKMLNILGDRPCSSLGRVQIQQGYKIRLPATTLRSELSSLLHGTRTVPHSRIVGRETKVATRLVFFPRVRC